jgi:hypothetical protein
MPEGTAASPVTINRARVVCEVCGQGFIVGVVPPQVVQIDPANPPVGLAGTGPLQRPTPQHVREPFWRCAGSGVNVKVVAEAGTWAAG